MQLLCEPCKIRCVVLGSFCKVEGERGASLGQYYPGREGPRGPVSPWSWCACTCVFSFLAVGESCPPLFWTHSHLAWGWGQVSIQSADAQEQVEGLLAENNALRTSLAALEQVQDTRKPSLIPLRFLISCF